MNKEMKIFVSICLATILIIFVSGNICAFENQNVYEHTNTRLVEAKEYLKEAVKIDPSFVNARVKLATVEEEICSINQETVRYSPEAVKQNIQNKEYYSRFIDDVFWNSQEEEGIEILHEFIKKNPDNPDYLFDLARIYYSIENHEKSLSILDSVKNIFPQFSECRRNYLCAKNLFEMNKMNEGLDYYMSAITSIQDSADMKAFYNDICYIMDNDEYDEYNNTRIASIGDFYSRFWRSRDPDLATERNERIVEHYQRLSYARKWYRRYNVGRTAIDFVHETEHPLTWGTGIGIKVGNDFLKTYISKAVPEKRYFDDMGLIYIRHGQPDNQVFEIRDAKYQNMSWHYYPRYNRSELVFHFAKFGGTRGWIIESMPFSLTNREEIHPLYWNPDYLDMVQLNESNEEFVEIGVRTETTEYKYDKKPLDFPFNFLTFKGENGKIRVELYFGIEGKEFELETGIQGNTLNLSRFVGIYDENWNESIRINKDDRIPVNLTPDEWKNSSATEMEHFEISPGIYNYEFHLQDKVSDKFGVYKDSLTINDYWKDDFMISDILLSGSIDSAVQNTPFQKGDLSYNPHMFNDFEKDATVSIYYELYNLTYDSEGKTHFQVTLTVQPFGTDKKSEKNIISRFAQRLFGQEKEIISSTYEYSGHIRDEKLHFNLKTENEQSGKYELIISVRDMNSDKSVRKIVIISII